MLISLLHRKPWCPVQRLAMFVIFAVLCVFRDLELFSWVTKVALQLDSLSYKNASRFRTDAENPFRVSAITKNQVKNLIENFMESFGNVLYSYINSIIESEFFGNGIFLENGAYNPAPILLPLSILMPISNTYKINLSIYLVIIPIRIDFCSCFSKHT